MKLLLFSSGAALLVVAVLAASFGRFLSHPTDQAMLGIFRSHQEQLETAVHFLQAKDNVAIGEVQSSDATSHKLYSLDLAALGVRSINKWSDDTFAFYYSVHVGSVKGIVFWPANTRPKDERLIVNNLDSDLKRSGIYLKPINDDWCLFLYIMD